MSRSPFFSIPDTGARRVLQAVICIVVLCACSRVPAADVWCPNPCEAVFTGPDYTGKCSADARVRIVAARNGRFTGQAVIVSKDEIPGPRATMSDLKQKGGSGVIPADSVRILYALPTGGEREAGKRFKDVKGLRRFDALVAEPGPAGNVHPVWIKVNVPKDAQAGDYEGVLSVADRKVPVDLKVCPWTLPDPIDYLTHANFVQSPESVALRYKAPMWSDRHFELIGKTFDLLAETGNKVVYLYLICHTHFGNEESMVRWIKDGDGYKYDFTPAEKYLDLFIKHIGKPRIVCCYVWDYYAGGDHFGRAKHKRLGDPILVTQLDPSTGKTEIMKGPAHGAPDSVDFWKPVMSGLRERFTARDIPEKAVMVGIGGDLFPNLRTVETFIGAAPFARWFVNSHSRPTKLYNKVDVAYLAFVWGISTIPDPDTEPDKKWKKQRYFGWSYTDRIWSVFPRDGGRSWMIYPPLWPDSPLAVHRSLVEVAISCRAQLRSLNGIGRVGADFWPVEVGESGKSGILIDRYPESNWHQLSMTTSTACLLNPGPEGATSTIRYEMLREGFQECEAKAFMEKTEIDKAMNAKVPEALRNESIDILKERLRHLYSIHPSGKKTWEWLAAESNWQDRTEKLFNMAGKLEEAVKN